MIEFDNLGVHGATDEVASDGVVANNQVGVRKGRLGSFLSKVFCFIIYRIQLITSGMFGLKSNEKEWILSHIEIDIGTSKLVSLSPDHLQRIIIIWQLEPQSQRFPVLNSTASQKWPQNNHHLCVVACCWATCRPGISIVAFSFDHYCDRTNTNKILSRRHSHKWIDVAAIKVTHFIVPVLSSIRLQIPTLRNIYHQ